MVGDSGAIPGTPQQMVSSVVSQATSNADWEMEETGHFDLSHSDEEDAPSSEAIGKGGPSGKNPRGVPVRPKGRIDKDEGSRAAANSKGEEEHQPPKGAPPAEAGNRGPKKPDTRAGAAESQVERWTYTAGEPQAAARETPDPVATPGEEGQEETHNRQHHAGHQTKHANMVHKEPHRVVTSRRCRPVWGL